MGRRNAGESIEVTPPPNGGAVVIGTFGNDQLQGTSGDDFIEALAGDDFVNAGAGNDFVTAYVGNDTVLGGDGDDTLFGEYFWIGNPTDVNDILRGGAGNDFLYGEIGNDVLDGGSGNDDLDGGPGNNIYVFGHGYGHDVATLTGAGVDVIQFTADVLPSDVTVTRSGSVIQLRINGTQDQV